MVHGLSNPSLRWCLTGAGVVLTAALAHAGPLDRSIVDARAAWVVHIDVEALRQSDAVREMLADPSSPLHQRMAGLKTEFGMDPLADIKSLTSYALVQAPQRTITVLTTIAATDDFVSVLAGVPTISDVHAIERRGTRLIAWTRGGVPAFASIRAVPGKDERQVFLAGTIEELDDAMGVTARGSIEAAKGIMGSRPSEGSILFAVAGGGLGTGALAAAPSALLFRSANEMMLEIGQSPGTHPEDDECLVGRAWMKAADEQTAADCEAVIRGMKATGALMARENPRLAGVGMLAKSVEVHRDGCEILMSARQPVRTVMDLLGTGLRPGGPENDHVSSAAAK